MPVPLSSNTGYSTRFAALKQAPPEGMARTRRAEKSDRAGMVPRSNRDPARESSEYAMQDCGCIGQLTVGGLVDVIIGRGFAMQSTSRPKLAAREMFYCTK